MKNRSGWLFGLLLLLTPVAWASPFTVTGDSGYRGDAVSVMLSDTQTSNLYAATIEVLFDPVALVYDHATFGGQALSALDTLFINDSGSGSGRLIASLASSTLLASNAEAGSLLEVFFSIQANAPFGNTNVTFQCLNDASGDTCTDDYNIPATSGQVNVLQRQSVPAPDTLWLLALGLPVLVAFRARR